MTSTTSDKIQKQLNNLSCPFTWNLKDTVATFKKVHLQHLHMDKENIDDNCAIPLDKFIFSLILCYECTIDKDMDTAELKLQEGEKWLENMKKIKAEDIDGIIRTIQHIFDATKCHLFFHKGIINETESILKCIINVSDMTRKELGALSGCQSIAWTYFNEYGINKAIEHLTTAIRQNPENPLWYFLLGKNLRRSRRYKSIHTHPGETEKKSFEKAYEMSKNPYYGIYLAQMFRETMYGGTFLLANTRAELEKKLLKTYEEIFNMENLSVPILLKLTLGFIRISSINCEKQAKACLDIIEKKDPNHAAYLHYKALYLKKFHPHKTTEILKYFKAAGELNNFPADLGYAEVIHSIGIDPIQHLKEMLIRYEEAEVDQMQHLLLAISTSYYLKRDINNAAEYYLKAVEKNPKSAELKSFYKFCSFNTKFEKSIYGFLTKTFLPILQRESNIDNVTKNTYLKLKQLCEENVGQRAHSFEDELKHMKL